MRTAFEASVGGVALCSPPFTDTNGPYASLSHLAGFLASHGIKCHQIDLGIEALGRLLSADGLMKMGSQHPTAAGDLEPFVSEIDGVMAFLRGDDSALALRYRNGVGGIGRRSAAYGREGMAWTVEDAAKLNCGRYLRRLEQVITTKVDDRFSLTGFGDRLVKDHPTFTSLKHALATGRTAVIAAIEDVTVDAISALQPRVLGITIPFPGCVAGAVEVALVARRADPSLVIVAGGGWINTELRSMRDTSILDVFDFITLDDGYEPFLRIINATLVPHEAASQGLERTFSTDSASGRVIYHAGNGSHCAHEDTGGPSLRGERSTGYFSLVDPPNLVYRLWSDWRWNKLMVSQGCYWRQCTFCDVGLDYVGRYERVADELVVRWMDRLASETGSRAFHFVDEALSPKALHGLSERLLSCDRSYIWWGNVRFERSFSAQIVHMMAQAGCVAISGGLEAPIDRLLKRVNKGVNVAQAAQVMRCFAEHGILVHAYLMFGLPSQTLQEVIDGLEVVRQLFALGWLHNAHWHLFSLTRHSLLGCDAEPSVSILPGIGELELPVKFAEARAPWVRAGLERSLAAYVVGAGWDESLTVWFDNPVPRTSLASDYVDLLAST